MKRVFKYLIVPALALCALIFYINHDNRYGGIPFMNKHNPLTVALIFIICWMIAFVLWDLLNGNWVLGQANALSNTGLRASAKVLSITETGWKINRWPVVKFVLDVYPEGAPPYRAQRWYLVPLIALSSLPKPGEMIAIFYDPKNPKSVAIDLQTNDQREADTSIDLITPGSAGTRHIQAKLTPFLEGLAETGTDQEKRTKYFMTQGQKVMGELLSVTPGPTPDVHYEVHLRWIDPQNQAAHEMAIPVKFDIQNPQSPVQKTTAPVIQKFLSPDPSKRYLVPIYMDPGNPEIYIVRMGDYEELQKK